MKKLKNHCGQLADLSIIAQDENRPFGGFVLILQECVMRRKEKEISSRAEIEDIIRRSSICRVAMCEDNKPYIVPLSFGYKDNTLYFHSAYEGKKIDILKANNNVCFEFDIDYELEKTDVACDWTTRYRSVLGFGRVSFITDPEDKKRALDIIMKQYSDNKFEYMESSLKKTLIIKIDISEMSGKKENY